jgi:hypothetical protein
MRQAADCPETAVPLRDIDCQGRNDYFRCKETVFTVPRSIAITFAVRRPRNRKRATLVTLPKYAASVVSFLPGRFGLRHLCFHSHSVTVVSASPAHTIDSYEHKGLVGHGQRHRSRLYQRLSPTGLRLLGAAAGVKGTPQNFFV